MAPKKKRKKNSPKKKKAAPEKALPEIPLIVPVVVPEASPPIFIRPANACICIENNDGWFCMRRLPNGELKECDGPFETKEECEEHVCK